MGIWIKRFTDGNIEYGDDIAIQKKQASWSRGRLTDIESVTLQHDKYRIEIRDTGEYWQSDTYESIFPYPVAKIVKRRIERKISEQDKSFKPHRSNNELYLLFNNFAPSYVPIKKEMIGQWMIVELDLKELKTHFYISPNRI